MLQRIREMMRVLPHVMADIIRHAVLTGLRPSETCESVKLLNSPTNKYYNPEQQTLEHFRFPEIFRRPTKKEYLSYITLDNLQQIGSLGPKTSLAAIGSACKRRKIQMSMNLSRKIFASYLRQMGIKPEVVDLLQGRVSQSVLTRHYLAPSQYLKNRVLDAVAELQKQIQRD
jgi:intergrase/recombinase